MGSTLLLASLLLAAGPWAKVAELKSGAEVRVFRKDSPAAIPAKFDELTADNLIVVVKNAQVAIPRDAIDRIDARPNQPVKPRLESQSRTVESKGDALGHRRSEPTGKPTTSTSTSINFGSKPDFETVYRRGQSPPPR